MEFSHIGINISWERWHSAGKMPVFPGGWFVEAGTVLSQKSDTVSHLMRLYNGRVLQPLEKCKPKEKSMNCRTSTWLQVILTGVLLIWTSTGLAQETPAPSEVLTNETIIMLTKAGLNPQIIVSKIQASPSSFNVTIDELVRLKGEKVADEVVNAMIQATQTEAQKKEAAKAKDQPKADPNDPHSPHESGIYFLSTEETPNQLIQMDASVYSQSKSGGIFKSALTYGIAKIKSKAIISGDQAKLQISESRPVFYFYFDVTNTGLSNSGQSFGASSTSPNEFVLVKMDQKKNSRELIVGQMNAFGAQSGTLDKYVQLFEYEKLAPGIFKVTPKTPLSAGEYCFYYAGATPLPTYGMVGATGGGKVFDFGVKSQQAQ